MVFLEPEPYPHDTLDIVNHTADTVFEGMISAQGKHKSKASLRGRPIDMPQPQYGPVERKDLVIALTSSADRYRNLAAFMHSSRTLLPSVSGTMACCFAV